jgi:ribosome-associated protein
MSLALVRRRGKASLALQICYKNMDDDNIIFINQQLQIPTSELQFRFSGSSGPGGQHVNKTATKVTLLFDVLHSPSLTDEQRSLLLEKLGQRLNKEGVLLVQAQDSRSQLRNRDTAVARFKSLLKQALTKTKKRKKTKPSQTAVEKRLTEKKKRGERKRERRRKWHD